MESTITGTVEGVAGRETKAGPIFDVVIGGKTYSTFKANIAEEAKALQGSSVEASVGITQKNGYTNYTLLGVKLLNAGGDTAASSTIPVAPASGMTPEREQKIVRQSSMATAFNYGASAGLSEEECFALAGRIYARAMGEKVSEPVVAVAPTETTDDIPW